MAEKKETRFEKAVDKVGPTVLGVAVALLLGKVISSLNSGSKISAADIDAEYLLIALNQEKSKSQWILKDYRTGQVVYQIEQAELDDKTLIAEPEITGISIADNSFEILTRARRSRANYLICKKA